MAIGNLFIIAAPSGAGKTSLVREMCRTIAGLDVSVSHTTRAQRPGEVADQDYHFIDQRTFERMIEGGEFLEHARVFDNFYGTARSTVELALVRGDDIILEIDWQGAQQVREMMPEAISIFILPPSRDTLEKRLRSRGQDSEEIIARRMRDAIAEMSHFREFDYLVVNDDFDLALQQLSHIVTSARLQTSRQAACCQPLIESLLA